MSALPQAIAWLEEHAKSWTLSGERVYSEALLAELKRLNDEVELQAADLRRSEEMQKKHRTDFLEAYENLQKLKADMVALDEAAVAAQTSLEARLTDSQEKRTIAENLLRDIHYGLLKQPELTREELANVITSVVTPYPEGAKP